GRERRRDPAAAAPGSGGAARYTVGMARGWESKAVEEMVEARAAEREAAAKPVESEADIARRARRDGLLLSRARVEGELLVARDPRYRAMLERSLVHLNGEIASVDAEADQSPDSSTRTS